MTDSIVVLVIGIPGAGKTTLIDRACSSDWTVLDTDRLRRQVPQALRRVPVPYLFYIFSIVRTIPRHSQVVVQSRGTYKWMRRLIVNRARACGHQAVLLMLDAPATDAVAGQVLRGRVAPGRIMRWHTARWSRLLTATGRAGLAAEGWTRIVMLDRAQASKVDNLAELTSPQTGRTDSGRPVG